MFPCRSILVILALLVLATSPGIGQQDAGYFPLKVGSKWHYRSGDEKVIVQVAKAEILEFAKKKGKEKVPGFTLKITSAGRELTEQVAVIPDDGVYRFSTAGKEIVPPLCILKFPIKKGNSWPIDSLCKDQPIKGNFTCDEADITVPAFKNKFRAVTTSFKGPKMSFEYYFAPGFGIVKQRIDVGNFKVVLELEKFEP
jgi:hypothetical protein